MWRFFFWTAETADGGDSLEYSSVIYFTFRIEPGVGVDQEPGVGVDQEPGVGVGVRTAPPQPAP